MSNRTVSFCGLDNYKISFFFQGDAVLFCILNSSLLLVLQYIVMFIG
jgi:hypothetical protein